MRRFAMALLLVAPLAARAQPSNGAEIWRRRCAMCHGEDGRGQTQQGQRSSIPDLTNPAWQALRTDERIRAAILLGGKQMPGFKDRLAKEDLDALVGFIRGLKGGSRR